MAGTRPASRPEPAVSGESGGDEARARDGGRVGEGGRVEPGEGGRAGATEGDGGERGESHDLAEAEADDADRLGDAVDEFLEHAGTAATMAARAAHGLLDGALQGSLQWLHVNEMDAWVDTLGISSDALNEAAQRHRWLLALALELAACCLCLRACCRCLQSYCACCCCCCEGDGRGNRGRSRYSRVDGDGFDDIRYIDEFDRFPAGEAGRESALHSILLERLQSSLEAGHVLPAGERAWDQMQRRLGEAIDSHTVVQAAAADCAPAEAPGVGTATPRSTPAWLSPAGGNKAGEAAPREEAASGVLSSQPTQLPDPFDPTHAPTRRDPFEPRGPVQGSPLHAASYRGCSGKQPTGQSAVDSGASFAGYGQGRLGQMAQMAQWREEEGRRNAIRQADFPTPISARLPSSGITQPCLDDWT